MRSFLLVCATMLGANFTVAAADASESANSLENDYVIIRIPQREEALESNASAMRSAKNLVRTKLIGVEPYPATETKRKTPARGGRLSPGVYVAHVACNVGNREATQDVNVIASLGGYEFLVECVALSRSFVTVAVMKQPISDEDIGIGIKQAQENIAGTWKFRVKSIGLQTGGQLIIQLVDGELRGKIKTPSWEQDIKIVAQRRGIWFESKWPLADKWEQANFIGNFGFDGLEGEARLGEWSKATWTATKL